LKRICQLKEENISGFAMNDLENDQLGDKRIHGLYYSEENQLKKCLAGEDTVHKLVIFILKKSVKIELLTVFSFLIV
jgi:hypothetical protein